MPQKKLVVDSKQARRQFAQCQQCHKARDEADKLFTCTGCKCQKCQREHWPVHKRGCHINRAQRSHLENLDNQVISRVLASTSGDSDVASIISVHPLPSALKQELHGFTANFRPLLFQAAYNAIQVARYSMGWTQMTLGVFLERMPNCPPDSRPWSRFRVTTAEPVPVLALVMMHGMENFEDVLRQKEAQERIDQANGHLGTLTIVITCRCVGPTPPLVMHNLTWTAFGSHSRDELEISDNWRETLIDTVERMCERTPGATLDLVDEASGPPSQ
ncbi:uncharacterized protein FIBRA_04625 [Fibroporia radiculosa]|uniref:MYND-type domain-containing protein n=1 Tax=Fibroporia radiculosa TaxID=599839 RepID=J4G7N9_9APHY|nr:uncharacterized protein FIBRA_04625 [Fibroporia radiculosa]CCM02523.1 predicted protein [Fibroporia radiculosa]